MNKDSFNTISQRSAFGFPVRIWPRILGTCLVFGFAYFTLFVSVSECHGQADKTPNTHKPPTHTSKPIDTPVIPTDPPVIPTDPPAIPTDPPALPTDTPLPSSTHNPALTLTISPDCIYGPTPTAATQTAIPTCTPTSTQAFVYGGLDDSSTNLVTPIEKTSTPSRTQTLPPEAAGSAATERENVGAPFLSPSNPNAKDSKSGNPGNNPLENVSEAVSSPSGISPYAVRTPFMFWFTVLLSAGGAVAAFLLRDRKEMDGPVLDGGGAAAAMAIHPVTVGANGFSAWLAGQAPMLTQGEQVVLSKVRNGIDSALHLAGGVSDLKNISEIGTQEFLQLTAQSPFFTLTPKGMGLAGG